MIPNTVVLVNLWYLTLPRPTKKNNKNDHIRMAVCSHELCDFEPDILIHTYTFELFALHLHTWTPKHKTENYVYIERKTVDNKWIEWHDKFSIRFWYVAFYCSCFVLSSSMRYTTWIYEYKKNRVNSQWNRKWPIEMHDTQSETKKSMLQNQSPRANNSQAIEWASMNNWIQAKCKRNTFDCPFILFTVWP